MVVSYKKLFKILIDHDMKKKEFRDYVGISYSTMSKLEKGENTTVEVPKCWRKYLSNSDAGLMILWKFYRTVLIMGQVKV